MLDCFLWGYVKTVVYKNILQTIEQLHIFIVVWRFKALREPILSQSLIAAAVTQSSMPETRYNWYVILRMAVQENKSTSFTITVLRYQTYSTLSEWGHHGVDLLVHQTEWIPPDHLLHCQIHLVVAKVRFPTGIYLMLNYYSSPRLCETLC